MDGQSITDLETCVSAYHDTDDLSEEEIQRLLHEAEQRLRAAAEAKAHGEVSGAGDLSNHKISRYSLPKSEGQLEKHLYLRDKDGAAHAVPKRIIDPNQRRLADTLYAAAKIRLEPKRTVRITSRSLTCIHLLRMSFIPKPFDADQRSFLDRPATMRAYFIHSYSDCQFPASYLCRRFPSSRLTRISQNDKLTAGPEWFDMPKTELTPQLKRDLQMLEMRSVLDPHRHYKKDNRKGKVPSFSQPGTVIEGPTDWYTGRVNKKDRAKNFVDEAMTTEKQTGRFKRKYGEIQEAKTSGKKAHYKKLLAKRQKS